MLVFLDESYEPNGSGGLRHAYAGFGIHELDYRRLAAAVHQCKMKYFLQDVGMTPEEGRIACKSHMLAACPPEDVELKAVELLSARQLRRHVESGAAPSMLLVDGLLDAIAGMDVTVFATLWYAEDANEIHDYAGPLPKRIRWLLERVDMWMGERYPGAGAVIIPDTVHDGINRQVSKQVAEFLFRSDAGRRMRRLVPNPFWVDSASAAGAQVADIIAHVMMNAMRPEPEQKPLTSLWRKVVALEFRSRDLSTRGIRTVRGRK